MSGTVFGGLGKEGGALRGHLAKAKPTAASLAYNKQRQSIIEKLIAATQMRHDGIEIPLNVHALGRNEGNGWDTSVPLPARESLPKARLLAQRRSMATGGEENPDRDICRNGRGDTANLRVSTPSSRTTSPKPRRTALAGTRCASHELFGSLRDCLVPHWRQRWALKSLENSGRSTSVMIALRPNFGLSGSPAARRKTQDPRGPRLGSSANEVRR